MIVPYCSPSTLRRERTYGLCASGLTFQSCHLAGSGSSARGRLASAASYAAGGDANLHHGFGFAEQRGPSRAKLRPWNEPNVPKVDVLVGAPMEIVEYVAFHFGFFISRMVKVLIEG